MLVIVVSPRDKVEDERFELSSPPRVGDVIRTRQMAAAMVTHVSWDLMANAVTVYAG